MTADANHHLSTANAFLHIDALDEGIQTLKAEAYAFMEAAAALTQVLS